MPALRTYLALAVVVGGGYLLIDRDVATSPDLSLNEPAPKRAARVAAIHAPRTPTLVVEPVLEEEIDEEIAEADADDIMRGHDTIEDPAELAFVFSVDGVSYVRLSTEERAESRGTGHLTEEDGVFSVVAPVATRAMPAQFRAWAGRSVLVDGSCRARIVGFAEVSRVSGEASNPYDADGEEETEPATWTVERVTDDNVVLAGKLDGCTGTWARSVDYSPAAVVAKIDAPDLEGAARADLLAHRDLDLTQEA